MTLSRDNYIESVNRNVELVGIVIYGFVSDVEDRVAHE
jgi:hypothetical protein